MADKKEREGSKNKKEHHDDALGIQQCKNSIISGKKAETGGRV